ncbi:MlaE family lipid ABC transporter permease subunit [Xanthobacter sp. TB0139]|uniref:MlaE family lipid ABC transporter permease subunit n=1 Tax=Xanthobacter sp. TB0139 TaxID=3459178 RepID=UPI004039EBF9
MISVQSQGDHLAVSGHGLWTAECADALEQEVDATTAAHPVGQISASHISLDLSGIERMDTFGAVLLERLMGAWTKDGLAPEVVGLSPRHAVLLREVEQGGNQPRPPARHREKGLELLGHNMVRVAKDALALMNFVGAVMAALGRVIIRPRTFRFTSMVAQMDRVGLRAVPIVLLITFLIGAIIAQQGIFHFRSFGADIYVVDMVGVLVLRELGVLIVAIMLAGRSGSAYTAELGSMRMREEMDALRVMGFDPIEVLVVPRILAIVISLPLLTFIGSMAALVGGGLVCWFYGGITPDVFMARLKTAIDLNQFEVGMYKAPFMAATIGIVACLEGMRVGGSAESLGERTTASVVKAIFLVIVMDGLFAIFFAAVNM